MARNAGLSGVRCYGRRVSKRLVTVERKTKETRILVQIDLDGSGQHAVKTPLPFLTHMLDQIGRHGMFDLTIDAEGQIFSAGWTATFDGTELSATFGDTSSIDLNDFGYDAMLEVTYSGSFRDAWTE